MVPEALAQPIVNELRIENAISVATTSTMGVFDQVLMSIFLVVEL